LGNYLARTRPRRICRLLCTRGAAFVHDAMTHAWLITDREQLHVLERMLWLMMITFIRLLAPDHGYAVRKGL
jgi:hypothetical protein